LDAVLAWTAPDDNEDGITAYQILIQQDNTIFSEETVDCDGSQVSIVAAADCSVPLTTLRGNPYWLDRED
jgi:hypothetical protein